MRGNPTRVRFLARKFVGMHNLQLCCGFGNSDVGVEGASPCSLPEVTANEPSRTPSEFVGESAPVFQMKIFSHFGLSPNHTITEILSGGCESRAKTCFHFTAPQKSSS